MFTELNEVLYRPKFKKYFSNDKIEELKWLLYEHIEWIEISEQFDDCRDKKDNFLLDLSVSGNADYLVTGDDDLLTLNPFHNVNIISYVTFQKILL